MTRPFNDRGGLCPNILLLQLKNKELIFRLHLLVLLRLLSSE